MRKRESTQRAIRETFGRRQSHDADRQLRIQSTVRLDWRQIWRELAIESKVTFVRLPKAILFGKSSVAFSRGCKKGRSTF